MGTIGITLCKLGVHLDEITDALAWGLRELGYQVSIQNGSIDPNGINILLAGFMLNLNQVPLAETRFINYNLEQIGGEARVQIGAQAFSLMRNLPNWDYSTANISVLKAGGICDVGHVPIGYAPPLESIKYVEKDIDVLFYGSLSERRLKVLKNIEDKGLNVVWANPWPMPNALRDERIARAKIVLNMAFHDDIHVFEEVRVSFLLANRVCVLSELTDTTQIDEDMRRCVDGTTLDQLPDLCAKYCADAGLRNALATRGYEIFRARDWLGPLQTALQACIGRDAIGWRALKSDVEPPRKLNIGSGRKWRHDFVNIDLNGERGADVTHDLSLPFAYDAWIQSWRFGRIKLQRVRFDYILAEYVFEHVPDLIQCMTTCLEWLRVGGTLELEVPHELSYGARQAPTCVRAFNERSWAYYTDWYWRAGWREFRFEMVTQLHVLSDLGMSLTKSGVEADVVIRMPRAVDALRVVLVKRALSEAEKLDHAQYFRTVS